MPTPDIKRENVRRAVLRALPYFESDDLDSFHYHLEEKDAEKLVEAVLKLLSDREKEIVAGIEGMKYMSDTIVDARTLDAIVTKITNGEI